MIILATEKEVYHQDGNGRAGDDHETVADEEEAKHVVHLAKPDGRHDEVEFHEDGAERKNTNEEHRGNWSHVERGRRDLARDLVGADRGRDCRLAETYPASSE